MNYTVLNPQGIREPIKRIPISPRLSDLNGKVIYCVAQDRPVFTEEISKRFSEAVPEAKIIYRQKPGWIRDEDQELWNEIYEKADAMIYGTCMGGGSGLSAVTWIKEVEKRGIPSVYIVDELYFHDIRMSAEMRGIPSLRTVMVSLIGEEQITEDVIRKRYSDVVSKIKDALTVPLNDDEKDDRDILSERPPRIAMTGSYEEVQEYFSIQQWSDGLPIVPPTEEKVTEMLQGTSHSPEEAVTACMYPEELTVTVEKAAVVGVMAGCKPEYMPLLLAILETWGGNPIFAQSARSDSTFSVMTIVNGPIRNEIGMNAGSNAMGPGNRANATIGRFLRLAILCLGNSLPAKNDMSAQGSPVKYGFCFPEHEEENPWEPFHVSMGYKAEDSVVSLSSGGWCHWSFSGDLDQLSRAISLFQIVQGAVVIMAPGAARLYASKGMSKQDVENYISEHIVPREGDFIPTWYRIDMPLFKPGSDDKKGVPKPTMEIKILVVGGETSQPVAQAWHFARPIMTSVDKWR